MVAMPGKVSGVHFIGLLSIPFLVFEDLVVVVKIVKFSLLELFG
jgi:hypothetical protein